jgi:hypothetical protein
MVSVASDNPAAQNIPIDPSSGAEIIPVLKLNFAAGANSVTVTGLNVNRSGLSADSDLQNVFLMEGNVVIATNLGISNGVINFSNGNGLFTVNANATQEITVAIEITTGIGSGHTYAFSVASASGITSNAPSVGGSFPISGNTMTGTTVNQLGALQISNSSAATSSSAGLSVNAGQKNYLVGQFTLTAQNQSVQVKSIKLTQTGSVAASDVANYSLYNGGTLVSSVAAVNGQNVTFDLSANPLQLASGNVDTMYVYVDVLGGVNRNFQLSVQHNYDIIANDMMFNFGILPYLSSGSFPMYMSYVNVSSGSLTVSRDANSPTNYVLPGGTNQVIAKIDMMASGEAVRITGLDIDLSGTSVDPTYITNLKAVDDIGQQIGTTATTITTTTNPVVLNNQNYLIPANTTRVISIIADLSSSATGNIIGGLSNIVGQGYTSLASVTSGQTLGNTLTANATMLSAYLNNAMGNTTLVSGQKNVKIASFALTAGAATAVSVSNLSLTTAGNVAANFQNLKVMVGSTQIGQSYGTLADSTVYSFSPSSPISITAGQQVNVDVYADTITGGNWSGTNVVSLATVSATAVSTGQAISSVSTLPVIGQSIAFGSAGTVSIALYNTPAAQQIGMGMSNVKLATYQITGTSTEAVTLQNIYLQATTTVAGSTGGNNLFSNFRLMNGSTVVASGLNLNGNGSIEWTGVNYTVPQNGYVNLDVVADANSWSALQTAGVETNATNSTIYVNMYKIDTIGVASGVTTSSTNTATSSVMQLLRTVIAPAVATNVTMGGSGNTAETVGALTFSNTGTDTATPYATLSTTTINLILTNATSGASTATTTYTVYNLNGNTLATGTITLGTATAIPLNPAYAQVPANGSLTIYIVANTTINNINVRPSGSNSQITINATLSGYNWSDYTRTGLSANTYPSNLLPITSANAIVN